MITESPLTDNLLRLKGSESDFDELVSSISSTKYGENGKYGFVIKESEANRIEAHLIVKSPTSFRDYNEEKNIVERVEQDRRVLIPFRLDFQRQFLEVFSDKQNTKKVVSRLGASTNRGISIDSMDLDLPKVYSMLSSSSMKFNIKSLRIRDFSINEYTSGNYYLTVYEQSEGKRLINDYASKISYIGLEFTEKETEKTVGLYDSGSVRLFSNIEYEDDVLDDVKRAVNHSTGVM